MKKSVKLVTAAATAMMLGGGITPTLASASTNANVSTNVGNNIGLKLQSFDQYIYVKNNEGSYDGITDKLFDIIHHKGAFYYGKANSIINPNRN